MHVELLKITIWAPEKQALAKFYCEVFGASVVRENPAVTEVSLGGGLITIHGGGEGKRTWTGLTLQVPDVVIAAKELVEAGGELKFEPQEEGGEPPHLAMCIDPAGNELMLTRKRS